MKSEFLLLIAKGYRASPASLSVIPLAIRFQQVVFAYDQIIRPHRSYRPSGGVSKGLGPATGGFACNCQVSKAWTTEAKDAGAKDAACTWSLCSIRSGSTNCINFPCPLESGPSSSFWASQPLEPAEWLALLILKAGDVESNPGPQNRKLPPPP